MANETLGGTAPKTAKVVTSVDEGVKDIGAAAGAVEQALKEPSPLDIVAALNAVVGAVGAIADKVSDIHAAVTAPPDVPAAPNSVLSAVAAVADSVAAIQQTAADIHAVVQGGSSATGVPSLVGAPAPAVDDAAAVPDGTPINSLFWHLERFDAVLAEHYKDATGDVIEVGNRLRHLLDGVTHLAGDAVEALTGAEPALEPTDEAAASDGADAAQGGA